MKQVLVFPLVLFLLSCKDKHENCDFDYLDQNSYSGYVNYCNAMAGKQLIFDARATLKLIDSAFIVSIVSIDTVMTDFNFSDTALVECLYGEGKIHYRLNSLSNQEEEVGYIESLGYRLEWKIFLDPCFDSTYFIGDKE